MSIILRMDFFDIFMVQVFKFENVYLPTTEVSFKIIMKMINLNIKQKLDCLR